jgi:O-antigen ligase
MGGSVDKGSIEYRQQLANRAWELFQENPFLGDKLVLQKMEDLRQGVGLIDLVNTYAEVLLLDGLIGLALFVGFLLVPLARTIRLAKRAFRSDLDLGLLGASLASCMVGTLLMIATCSFIFGYQKMFYVLAGLGMAYSRLTIGSDLASAATIAVPKGKQSNVLTASAR